jgi:tetratricopeptide (TPR) repeat protein
MTAVRDPASVREERDFLLASLDDLEAEYAAGDLDEADYRALRSDYTTRAAAAIRALDEGEDEATAAPEPLPGTVGGSWRRIAIWTVLVVVIAGLAGVWVAEFSGSRGEGESITGDIRDSVRTRLFRAGDLLGADPAEAMAIYDDVLLDAPSNAEALAYRGWLTNLEGDPATAREFLEDAVVADPEYPDARVFAAAVALDAGDVAVAADHLRALDAMEVPPFIEQLVQAQGLRVRVVEGLLLTGEPDAFAASGLTVDEVARAADALLIEDEIGRALALHEVLLTQARDDLDVVTEAGWFLGLVASRGGDDLEGTLVTAAGLLDEALEIDSDHPPALVYRAFVRAWLDDRAGARADLATYDALPAGREELDFLIAELGLREQLA